MKKIIVVLALTLLGMVGASHAVSMEECEKLVSDLETDKAMACLDVQRKLSALELIDAYQDKLKTLSKKDRSNLVAAQKSWESTLKSCSNEFVIEKESDYLNVLLCEISKIRGRRVDIKASN